MSPIAKGWPGVIDRSVDESTASKLTSKEELSKRPFAFLCSRPNCYKAVSAKSREHAEQIEREHTCPHVGGITHIGGTVTLTLLETCWAKADLLYDKLVTAETEVGRDKMSAQLNGMCQVIAVFMPPLMHTAREVGDELRKRKAMRDAGEEYETPGLGARRYESAAVSKYAPIEKKSIPASTLDAGQQDSIRKAHSSGLFTVEQLAGVYKVTQQTIRTVLETA